MNNKITIDVVEEHYLSNSLVRNAVMVGMDKDAFIRLILDELKESQDELLDALSAVQDEEL